MAVTPQQALAFADAITKARGAHFFEAQLGFGCVPTMKNFVSTDPEALDRCEEFICCIEENISCLRGLIGRGGRQMTLDDYTHGELSSDDEAPEVEGDEAPEAVDENEAPEFEDVQGENKDAESANETPAPANEAPEPVDDSEPVKA